MAKKTVANLKDSVSGLLQGLNLNNVTNLYGAFERVGRQTCTLLDIPETTFRQNFTLYDGVTDYAAPSGLFGTAEVDIRPQGTTRYINDTVQKEDGAQFDREKGWIADSTITAVEFDNGTGIIRVVSPNPTPRIDLDSMTDDTGWTAAGSASALTTDESILWQSPASLRFTLTGASTGTLTKTINSADLTDYKNVGVAFLALRLTTGADLTSVTLKLGSDSSNYYSVTATAAFLKAFADLDWMLVSFDFSTASTTGTPDITKIAYAQLSFTTTATEANVWCGDLWISLPYPSELLYKDCALFAPTGSTTYQNTITADTDSIIFTDEAFSIYEIKCAQEIALQQGGTLASGLYQTLDERLNGIRGYRGILIQLGLLDMYRANNPSDRLRQTSNYYEDFRA